MSEAPPSSSPPTTHELLTRLGQLAEAHARTDLVEAVSHAIRRLRSTAFRVVVVGEYKKGKSSLINALVDAPVCAVDDDIATAARLEVGFGEEARAARWWRPEPDGDVERAEIPVREAADASTRDESILVRVSIPRRLLKAGLVVVDTPGAGGIGSAAATATASTLDDAHAVLFVTDASQELTRAEADALVDAARRCPRVAVIATKIDVYPHWRDIVQADREHLERLGLDLPIIPVSSTLRMAALRAEDSELNRESGFPTLLQHVTEGLLVDARQIVEHDAAAAARRIAGLLREPLVREFRALEAGGDGTEAVAAAAAEFEAFKKRVQSWQLIMADGLTDLVAAVDTDLRARFRQMQADNDQILDDGDPDEIWGEFEPELYRRAAEALDANLAVLREHAATVAGTLAELIDEEGEQLVPLDEMIDADEPVDGGAERPSADDGASGGSRAQQAFRAGYGGAMPIMMVGGMALGVLGLGTLVMPVAALAGVMAGRKALRDERDRRIKQRRQQARIAARKYCDETMFRASTERKRMQRQVQRALRDHVGERVKELGRTHQETVTRAQAAAKTSAAEREARMGAIRTEVGRIDGIVRALGAVG